MDISHVIAISGMPGLFKVIGQSKGGVIVESLIDKKRFPAFANSPISKLEDISIYTTSEEKPLKEVLAKIMEKENGGTCLDPKKTDETTLRAYMESVVPEYDQERVHLSDLKKLFNWYNLLHTSGLLTAEEKKEEGEEKSVVTEKSKSKNPAVKKEVIQKQNSKSNAPVKKTQGVRKTGTA
jgi:Domain of unknown function (DUF5606)